MTHWDQQTADKYVDLGPQKHLTALRPVFLSMLGDLSDQEILDFGCGDGRFASILAGHGPRRVLALDQSQTMLDAARGHLAEQPELVRRRIELRLGDEQILSTLGCFDAILCSLVLMMCGSQRRLEATIQSLIAALSPGGKLVIAVTHPCFRQYDYGDFHYEVPRQFNYWTSGAAYRVVIEPNHGPKEAEIIDHHWTLTDYAQAIAAGGGCILRLVELPTDVSDCGDPIGEPAYLVLLVVRAVSVDSSGSDKVSRSSASPLSAAP